MTLNLYKARKQLNHRLREKNEVPVSEDDWDLIVERSWQTGR